jgi:hypothetical protein
MEREYSLVWGYPDQLGVHNVRVNALGQLSEVSQKQGRSQPHLGNGEATSLSSAETIAQLPL